MLSWEKPLVKPMAPGSISYHISFESTFICIFYFPIYIIKYQKNLSYHIISIRSHFCKWPWRDWQPLYRVGCKVLDCLCRCIDWRLAYISYWIDNLVLNWGIYLSLLCCITLSSSRENQRSAQEVARRISGVVAGEAYTKSSQDSFFR